MTVVAAVSTVQTPGAATAMGASGQAGAQAGGFDALLTAFFGDQGAANAEAQPASGAAPAAAPAKTGVDAGAVAAIAADAEKAADAADAAQAGADASLSLIAALAAPTPAAPAQAQAAATAAAEGAAQTGTPATKGPAAATAGADAGAAPTFAGAVEGALPDATGAAQGKAATPTAPQTPQAPAGAPTKGEARAAKAAALAATPTPSPAPTAQPAPAAPQAAPAAVAATAAQATAPTAANAALAATAAAAPAAATAAEAEAVPPPPAEARGKESGKESAKAGRGAPASTRVEAFAPATPGVTPPGAGGAVAKPAAGEPSTDAGPKLLAAAESRAPEAPVEHHDAPDSAPAPAPAAASTSGPAAAQAAAQAVRGSPETVANLAAQIIKKLDGRSTKFDVELYPAGLGKVSVQVEIGAHGRMTAAMSFDNPAAAHELRARSGDLLRSLEQAGFDLGGGMSFDVAGDQGRWNRGQNAQDRDTGPSLRGRAFQAALDTAGEADLPAGPLNLRQGLRSGVDVRI